MTRENFHPLLDLRGPLPSQGTFCFTCCSLYIGAINIDPTYTADAKQAVDEAREEGRSVVDFVLPAPHSVAKLLRYAVTIGPSYQFPNVLAPVCWTHLLGYQAVPGQQGQKPESSPLIKGKANLSLSSQFA
jgi:hypothetical protein